jgi:hypothetical protein
MKQAYTSPHQEIYALLDSDVNNGIVVLRGPDGSPPMPCVALRSSNAVMFASLAKNAKEELQTGKRLLLVRFSNPEVIDVIEAANQPGEKK